eukprot:6994844-Prymnesium_polylepis.2
MGWNLEDAHELERSYGYGAPFGVHSFAGKPAFVTFATVAPATAPLLIAAIVHHFAAMVCRVEDTPPAAWMVPTPLTTTPNVLIVQGTNIQLAKPMPSTVPAPIRAPFAAVQVTRPSFCSDMCEHAVARTKVSCQSRVKGS